MPEVWRPIHKNLRIKILAPNYRQTYRGTVRLILSAHQPQYYGYLGYIDKILSSDKFVILDHVQYSHGDFINRNKIRNSNGWQWLTVPVTKESIPIKNIQIPDNRWQQKHLKSIQQNYSKAKHYDRHIKWVESLYSREWKSLSDVCIDTMEYTLSCLGCDTELILSSTLDLKESKSDMILELCQKLGADKFIFGAMGKDYADLDSFRDAGIEVEIQEFKHPIYNQHQGNFVECMASIDFLMNEVG